MGGHRGGGGGGDVRRYPEGASPAGCLQMCGNVAEWVAGEEGVAVDLARGGSFVDELVEVWGLVFCARRYSPGGWDGDVGFRVWREGGEGNGPGPRLPAVTRNVGGRRTT